LIDLKKRTPIIYARLSQAEAKSEGAKKLNLQIQKVKDYLKKNGIKGSPLIFKEVASGTDETRPQWLAAIAASMARKNRFLAVYDFSRFSRDMRWAMAKNIPMYESDVPILSTLDGVGMLTGTRANPHPDGDLMWGIKTTLVTREVETTKEKERTTGKTLRKAGIATTVGLSLYPFTNKNPWAVMIEEYPRLGADLKPAQFGELIALETKVGNKKYSPGPKWYRTALERWLGIKGSLSPSAYKAWWGFLNRVRDYEKAEGYDGAGRAYVRVGGTKRKILDKGTLSWPVKALRRMANQYLNDPADHTKPTQAEWMEWTSNPGPYLGATDFKTWEKLQ